MKTCTDCSRRTLLKGLGLAVLAVCADPTLPAGVATACGTDLCLDLGDSHNMALTSPGGALAIDTAHDTIMVVRVSDTQVVAVSALCTHQGCENTYTASAKTFDCPCHGSKFSLTGTVLRGPATAPLRNYPVTLAGNTITITVP
jgi:cytochrome b6-f complex iron-sulfur subunit